jgi:Sec-independent protein secretion pathway component TatC
VGLEDALGELVRTARKGKAYLVRILAFWLAAFGFFTVVPFGDLAAFHDYSTISWLRHSLAIGALRLLETHLLPHGETLIAEGPFDAFLSVMYVGAGLALLVTIPFGTLLVVRAYRIDVRDPETGERIVASGFGNRTKTTLRILGALAVGFFFSGVIFGLGVLPYLYNFGYEFQIAAGVSGTITLGGFLVTTAFFTLGLGALFEIPTVAYGLAVLGVLSSRTLRKHLRIAGIGSIVAAFVISPGVGNGLIEVPIAFLLFGLYVIAYYIVRGVERRRDPSPSPSPSASEAK